MEVSKLIQNMREQGIGIWTEGGKIRYLKKDGKLDDDIKNILIYNKKEIISYFEEERERFDKFPLTDIQMAYLLGRKNSFEYGDVASHLYLELDYPALDSVKVQKIWNQLIDKHDMLRAIVLEDGTQEVLRDVAEYPIYISTKCEEIRSKWSDKYYKGYALLIGARNQYKLQCLKEEFSTENIEIIQMDVFIPKQVEMFCSQCDVVINCTSPASIVGTRIVRECIKQGNDYIDPFGEGDVEKYIVDNKSMIGDKKTRIILSSGTYPGLSEALFKYVAEIHKGAEVSIKEYFYGNSYFSHGATQDVISSMINNKSKSMSFFYKDEIIPCKMRIGESICIDEKVGTMYLYPIISKDFRRVCKETGVKEGCFFNTFSDLSSMASFFEIGSKIYHSNSMDTFGYTEQLEKMYRNKSTENEKTIFWFGIELVNGNDVEKKLMSFEYACNWNSLSGYVCALVAEWCLNDEISKGKAYNLDEIEGIQKFIESLPGEIKQNIVKL